MRRWRSNRVQSKRPAGMSACALLALLVVWVPLASALSVPPEKPEVHLRVFLSETCTHCELVREAALRELAETRACRIVIHYHDVDDESVYVQLAALEERVGDAGNDLPVVFVGDYILGGEAEVEARLGDILSELSGQGAPPVAMPTAEEVQRLYGNHTENEAAAPVRLAYFETPGCRQCDRVDRMLNLAMTQMPSMEVQRYSLRKRSDFVLLEAMGERAGVAADRRLITPAVFVGRNALIGDEITDAKIRALCASAENGSAPWDITDAERTAAEQRLWEQARRVGVPAVLLGGLADGINPCAFATLVFFVTCLAGAGATRRRLLLGGGGFALGVFAAYFLTGVGLGEALLRLDFLPVLSQVLTWFIIVATLVLAGLALRDGVLALHGHAGDMSLKLPTALRMKINSMIARRLRAPALLPAAILLGGTVAMLEFVCTGQIYLPLLRYMTAIAPGRLRGAILLLIYNAAFVAPLIVVLAFVAFGLRSEKLLAFLKRHLAAMKFSMTLFFLGLAGLLIHWQLRGPS